MSVLCLKIPQGYVFNHDNTFQALFSVIVGGINCFLIISHGHVLNDYHNIYASVGGMNSFLIIGQYTCITLRLLFLKMQCKH